jgi:hypothetical protein
MSNSIDKREESQPNAEHDPVESGRKAIEADRLVNKKEIPEDELKQQESLDAEKWRNEG